MLMMGLLIGGVARPDDKPAKPPATVKVEKSAFKVEATLKGVIEAERGAELSLRPEVWANPLTILKAVEHGTPVKKGDVVLEIDVEKLDQAIKDAKIEHALGELTLKEATEEFPLLEKLLPLDLLAAERAKKQAEEDLKMFREIDRPQSEKMAIFMVKSSQQYLDYAREELNQLQKMYRSKDLTEETEEMILKRQRNQVESSEVQLKSSELQRDKTLKVELPRQEEHSRDAVIRSDFGFERSRIALPLALNQKRVALAKMTIEAERVAEKLAKLEKDREMMTVHAPMDGIVYYGKAVDGPWAGAAAFIPRLRKGGVISATEVFMTVVERRPVFIRAAVEEKDLHLLREDLKGKAVAVAYPDRKIPAKVSRILPVPQGPGVFEAIITPSLGDGQDAIMPGMACTVHFVSYSKDDALTLPAASVFEDDDSSYVYALEAGKPAKKTVKAGRTSGGKVEILDGLREGDEVLASKP